METQKELLIQDLKRKRTNIQMELDSINEQIEDKEEQDRDYSHVLFDCRECGNEIVGINNTRCSKEGDIVCTECKEAFEVKEEGESKCDNCSVSLENNTISPDGETLYCKNCMGLIG